MELKEDLYQSSFRIDKFYQEIQKKTQILSFIMEI